MCIRAWMKACEKALFMNVFELGGSSWISMNECMDESLRYIIRIVALCCNITQGQAFNVVMQ